MPTDKSKRLQINDFIVLNKDIKGIKANSVGLVVKAENDNEYEVFFISSKIHSKLSVSQISFVDLKKTGKPHKFKVCNVCHVLKDYYLDFEVNQTDAKGIKTTRPSCRECRKNIDGVSLITSEKRRLDKIKPEYYFVCPICEKGSIPGITANLVKDHNHDNGKARGWLCDSCNTGLGRFKDNIELLEKAISYLKENI